MAASVLQVGPSIFVLFGTSSGALIQTKLDYQKRWLSQVSVLPFDAAFLSMKRVKSTNFVACGQTNGDLSLIEVSDTGIKVAVKQRVHDFGVNCLDSVTLGQSVLIATGGDDQHLRVGLFSLQGEPIASARVQAHSSCVKGVAVYLKAGNLVVVSSGYDQRLKYWKVDHSGGTLQISKDKQIRHCLADMNGLCKTGKTIVLAGQGLAMFDV